MLNIDKRRTANNVKALFKKYDDLVRLSKREQRLNHSTDATKQLQTIAETINDIDIDAYRFIIENRFIKHYSVKDVVSHVGLSKPRFNDYQNDALVAFAELYYLDNLVVLGGGNNG
ncbi:hypothetical protein [Pediococcus pentosaceus]|uniref:hypothetical protein n=1 Tax=Pediococcus pentosaceus TaxID=1255 RepID=UPI001C7CFB4A|nr:hypothetical protein [Pediococcus pentosaceus]QYY85506.1 hypothetical protein GRI00_02600 [Pediococcus pentosaceus]